ncbi:dolichol-phosphate mannosyltransferase [Hyunsoonleella jejuensis]|uniref:Dolichol-phosphate mannosyltransferase n=1 Tax=Hyunsoonleella jejuensis TaxID=419940 RepID=A0A1H9D8B5_9FLAO|nr:glycosyltransferase family 2 protein [Hyunsoonleella jejuensis]SEQ09706.1 dolichol-phosphate mannosyltransferase [Hyunsoonleella jejuensis]
MANHPEISFVSPVYKAENILEELVSEVQKVMAKLNKTYEIILVDDRSPDDSWRVMKALSAKFPEVKSIRLSRNFGQHPAIMAGLSSAKGNWVVVMDCDMQDQPKEVEKLYNKALEGFDAVLAQRIDRKDSFFKRLSSKLYAKTYAYFTNTNYDNTVANFGIYKQKVIASILEVNDYIKYFPLFVKFVGYNTIAIEVEHNSREDGKSSYSIAALVSLAFNTIISFSNKPLKLFVKFGMLISLISFIAGIYTIYKYFEGAIEVLGYSSLIVSIWFLSGVIITIIGVTGIYVGKIFNQIKDRPVYIIDKTINVK